MHRIDTPTAQKDKFGQGKNGFTNGDPATGRRATDLNSDMWDAVQEEVCTVIEAAGIPLSKGEHTQLHAAIGRLIDEQVKTRLEKNQNGADIPNKPLFLQNVGLEETINLAAGALQKSQNGADIQDKSKFIENIGISDEIARSAESIVHSGDNIDNLNDAPKNSTSFAYASATNSPGFNATILTVNSLDDSFDMQIAIGYNPIKVAFRSKNGDTSAWQPWLILGAAASKGVGKSAGNLIQVEGGALYANAETVSNSNLNNDRYGSKFILQGGGSGNDLFGGYGAGIITGYDIPTKINSVVFVRSDGSITSGFRNNGVWTIVYNPSGFRRGSITSIATTGGSGGESRTYIAPAGSFICGLTNYSNDAYIRISAIHVAPMQVRLNGNWVTIDG